MSMTHKFYVMVEVTTQESHSGYVEEIFCQDVERAIIDALDETYDHALDGRLVNVDCFDKYETIAPFHSNKFDRNITKMKENFDGQSRR